MRITISMLTDERRAKIFEEGRQAAIANMRPFDCPYFTDTFPERFHTWCEGFETVDRSKH